MIERFRGEYRWLSNFWPAPVEWDGLRYPTVEHAYQAAKTEDPWERQEILHASTPGKAKRLGQKVTMHPEWDKIKSLVMYELLQQKFASGSGLAQKLLDTGDQRIYEGNTWHDNYWGWCFCDSCKTRRTAKPRNVLGNILMRIREELKEAHNVVVG